MSAYKTSYLIQKEINRLNSVIDLKIIRGLSYGREARRHKFLMSQLRDINRSRMTWLDRSFKFVSTFMF